MALFETKRRGYDKTQVDDYVFETGSRNEKTISQLRERIAEAESENKRLKARLDACLAREDSVSKALIGAIDKAKEIEYAAKVRYALEGERLKEFENKWVAFCNNKINKVAPGLRDETKAFVAAMKSSLAEVMTSSLNLGVYVNEAIIDHENEEERLKTIDENLTKTA